LEVTVCNSWLSGSLVLAMLHSPHALPNMYPTQFEWHTDMISCHICHLISPFFPGWHTTTSQERYTMPCTVAHEHYKATLFAFLHPVHVWMACLWKFRYGSRTLMET
jgi:hypothetical protein